MNPSNEKNIGPAPGDQALGGPGADGLSEQGHRAMVNQEGNGTIKQYYLILLCAIIAFMLAFGFIITTWVETMQLDHDIHRLVNENEPLGNYFPRGDYGHGHPYRIVSSMPNSLRDPTTPCGTPSSVSGFLTSPIPVTTQVDGPQSAITNCTSSPVETSSGSVLGVSSGSPFNGISSEHSTKARCSSAAATSMTNHGSAISSPPASAPDTPDTGYTSTTTVVVELTSFVTVTETLDIGTSATPNSNSAQPISSGASDGVLTTTASPMTVQPVSHATSTTIFRTVTSTISGVAKTVTITETRAIGTGVGTEIGSSVLGTHSNPAPFSTTATALPTGVTATSGTLVTPAVSGNVTWNYTSTNPFPPGPASTTVFPLVSGGSSKPKTKGGNSGNGSSGGSCILMLAAIAVGFISL